MTTHDPVALSPLESARLADLERDVERARSAFVAAGEALREIRDRRLYRTVCGTFDEYCAERWTLQKSQTYRLIEAADLVAVLRTSPMGEVLPANERQVRELTRLDDPEAQVVAWGKVVQRADADPKRITSSIIREEVQKLLPEPEECPFSPAEEAEALRKFVVARLKRCPEPQRAGLGFLFNEVLGELTGALPAPAEDRPAPADPAPAEALHVEALAALTRAARLLTAAVNDPEDGGRLLSALTHHNQTRAKTLWVCYGPEVWEGGRAVPRRVSFTGFRPLRALIRAARARAKPLTAKEVAALFAEHNVENPPEADL